MWAKVGEDEVKHENGRESTRVSKVVATIVDELGKMHALRLVDVLYGPLF